MLVFHPLTEEETPALRRVAQGLKVAARLRDRTRTCWLSHEGKRVHEIVALYETPPTGSVVICLDEMGPESAESQPGQAVIRPDPTGERRVRATQEIDSGRRGKGDGFKAFQPATGEAFTMWSNK